MSILSVLRDSHNNNLYTVMGAAQNRCKPLLAHNVQGIVDEQCCVSEFFGVKRE